LSGTAPQRLPNPPRSPQRQTTAPRARAGAPSSRASRSAASTPRDYSSFWHCCRSSPTLSGAGRSPARSDCWAWCSRSPAPCSTCASGLPPGRSSWRDQPRRERSAGYPVRQWSSSALAWWRSAWSP